MIAAITEILRRAELYTGNTDITAETRLVEDLSMDDLDVLELVMELEEKYNVSIDYDLDNDDVKMTTVQDVCNALTKAGVPA